MMGKGAWILNPWACTQDSHSSACALGSSNPVRRRRKLPPVIVGCDWVSGGSCLRFCLKGLPRPALAKSLEALRECVADNGVMTWPVKAKDVVPFLELAQVMDKAAPIGGSGKNASGYCHKAFLRKLLLAIEMLLGQELEEVRYSEVEKFLPDKFGLCAPFHCLSYYEVQALFGGSPFLVSAWTCLAKPWAGCNFETVADRLQSLLADHEIGLVDGIPTIKMASTPP